MSVERADTIVLGLGAMGSSTLYHAAKRGERVLGIDQFDPPHAMGSSHGYSRAIRMCYYEHPGYVPLLKRAYELWAELEKESGAKLLHITGGVYMGGAESEVVNGSLRSAREHGLAHEELSHADLARRYPMFRLPEDYRAIYEPYGGFLLSERVISVHVNLALRHGARVRTHERVESWSSDGEGVEVRTGRGVHRAKRLIITAGAWAQRLIGSAGVQVTPTRQVLGWVWPRRPELFALGRFPFWAIDAGGEGMYYGFPMMAPGEGPPGLKVARHVRGPVIDPDQLDRRATPADESDFRPALQRFLPDADGPVVGMRVCMYENSPTGHFIVGPHAAAPTNVMIAAGFSGHGFKFASVIGERLAGVHRQTESLPFELPSA